MMSIQSREQSAPEHKMASPKIRNNNTCAAKTPVTILLADFALLGRRRGGTETRVIHIFSVAARDAEAAIPRFEARSSILC